MNFEFYLLPILWAFLACAALFLLTKWKGNPKRLPPGPPRLPLLGNLHQIRNPLHRSLLELAKKHGDIMFLKLGQVPTLVVSSADVAREITKNHDIAFSGRPWLLVPNKLGYDSSDIAFAPYGEYWREIKKIAVLELLSSKKVQGFRDVRDEEVSLLVDSIARSSSGVIDLSEMFHSLSNNVLCRVAFGRKFEAGGAGRRTPQEMLLESQDLFGTICLSDFFPRMGWFDKVNGFHARLEKNFEELDQLFDQLIQEHLDPDRVPPEHGDLIDVLLRLKREANQNVSVSDKFIKALISDMFVAGTDTTSATLTWAMTELIRNPLVIKRAQDEIRNTINGKDKVEETDLPQLTYLRSVLNETLRVHPPGPLMIPRETIEDVNIRGYEIPAKTRVFVNLTAIFMDPKSWDDPYEFRPERFLNRSIDFKGQHFEFIPFGAGRRICPGMYFAPVVIELALANILNRFNWDMPPGVTRETMNVDEAIGLTVNKKTALHLVATPAKLKI